MRDHSSRVFVPDVLDSGWAGSERTHNRLGIRGHEALKAEIREVNRTREDLAHTGDDLRNRLGASLQTVHGFQSEKLIEFGIKPRRTRGRDRKPRASRSKPAVQPPTETPPAGSPIAAA